MRYGTNTTRKQLGLDTDPGARRPQDQQIVLLNREEVAEELGTAKERQGT